MLITAAFTFPAQTYPPTPAHTQLFPDTSIRRPCRVPYHVRGQEIDFMSNLVSESPLIAAPSFHSLRPKLWKSFLKLFLLQQKTFQNRATIQSVPTLIAPATLDEPGSISFGLLLNSLTGLFLRVCPLQSTYF